jgi:hypothetical protein
MSNVEKCRGLIEEQEARPLRESARNADPPLLSSAQRLDAMGGQTREVAASQRFVDRGFVLGPLAHPRALVRGATHGDDFANAKTGRDRLVLGHEGDEARKFAPAHLPNVLALDARGAAAGRRQCRRDAKQCRLSGSVGSKESHEVTFVHAQGYPGERRRSRSRIVNGHVVQRENA